jgi:hypothetical protein
MITDSLAKLNRSSRNSVFAALIVIAGVAMYNWIVSPHVTYLYAAQKYASAVGKIVEKNKAITRELDGKKKELGKLRDQYSQCLGLLFTPDEAKEFFGDLQTIPEETGCTVYSLNLVVGKAGLKDKRSEDTSGMVANSAILSVSGQYNNIMKLLEKLQNRPQKVWVDSFKIEIIDFGSAQLKCNMTITIYTIKDREVTL